MVHGVGQKLFELKNKKRRAAHEYVNCPFKKMQKSICRTVCRNPGCTHRSFSCSNHPAADEGFRQSAGSAPVRVHAGSESDRRHPGLLQDAECYHRSVEPSALARPCKYNIYKNIEGKADIPPFQCINSDVQK